MDSFFLKCKNIVLYFIFTQFFFNLYYVYYVIKQKKILYQKWVQSIVCNVNKKSTNWTENIDHWFENLNGR